MYGCPSKSLHCPLLLILILLEYPLGCEVPIVDVVDTIASDRDTRREPHVGPLVDMLRQIQPRGGQEELRFLLLPKVFRPR